MDDKTDCRIIILGEDNYVTWKWQVMMALKSKGLEDSIITPGIDVRKDGLTAIFLASTLSQLNMQRVINCTNAREIWDALEAIYENKSSTEMTMLFEKFTSYTIRSVGNISKDIGEIQALAARLKSLGATIDDEFIISIILKALPDSMKTWKSTWKMVNGEKLNLNNLITGIMAEVHEMQDPENTALVASDRHWKRKGGKNHHSGVSTKDHEPEHSNESEGEVEQNEICHYCNKPGHGVKDCRKKKTDEERGAQLGEQRWVAGSASPWRK